MRRNTNSAVYSPVDRLGAKPHFIEDSTMLTLDETKTSFDTPSSGLDEPDFAFENIWTVSKRIGRLRSEIKRAIQMGYWPRPILLSDGRIGWLAMETTAIVKLLSEVGSQAELRACSQRLEADRPTNLEGCKVAILTDLDDLDLVKISN